MTRVALALLLLAQPAAAAADEGALAYAPRGRDFSCRLPGPAWAAFEHETPRGPAVHILGPSLAHGAWRAALHVHHVERSREGFEPWPQAVARLRARDASTGRDATPFKTWRVGGRGAKLFEVRERRMLPADRLPAEEVVLHHYYAVIQGQGEDYFLVKLSTTEQAFLQYRPLFQEFLKHFTPS